MASLTLTLALAALAALPAGAAGAAPTPVAEPGAEAPEKGEPAEPDLDAPLDGDTDDDFEEERPPTSLALGPAGRGRPVLSVEVGWLRSGARAALGITDTVDVVVRGDAFLLYDGVDGLNDFEVGIRYTPFRDGVLRLGGEVTIGQAFAAAEGPSGSIAHVRGEVAAGAVLGFALVYARASLRGFRGEAALGGRWARDEELGAGVEARWRRLIGGAEVFTWMRPDLEALSQWRVRAGFAF